MADLSTDPKQILHRQLYIAQNRSQKARANDFARMYWNSRHPSIRVSQEDVTTPSPRNYKTGLFEETYQFLTLQTGKATHTEICWIPTSSSDGAA